MRPRQWPGKIRSLRKKWQEDREFTAELKNWEISENNRKAEARTRGIDFFPKPKPTREVAAKPMTIEEAKKRINELEREIFEARKKAEIDNKDARTSGKQAQISTERAVAEIRRARTAAAKGVRVAKARQRDAEKGAREAWKTHGRDISKFYDRIRELEQEKRSLQRRKI